MHEVDAINDLRRDNWDMALLSDIRSVSCSVEIDSSHNIYQANKVDQRRLRYCWRKAFVRFKLSAKAA
ncbi:MAG: hypothetical protein ACR2OV_09200 [Hyphomicrobiaceae bacterium]